MLLDKRHQRMDEIIKDNADYGGRYIKKQEEPIAPPIETPVIQEMRLIHQDFVEEAYWKRCIAMKLAHECKEALENKIVKKEKEKIKHMKEMEELKALGVNQVSEEPPKIAEVIVE